MTDILLTIWNLFCEMAPYLFLGFVVAGLLNAYIPTEKIEQHLGGKGFLPVIKASLFGVPLPLCSCGVIPVCASLRQQGASKGAVTSFIISTPQTGVDSILVTYSLLGWVFALLRPVAAFFSGVLGGFLVDALDGKRGNDTGANGPCACDKCAVPPSSKPARGAWHRMLSHAFVELPREIAMPLLIGTVIAGIISAILPDDIFARFLGQGFTPLLLMALMGIPVYVCATASVPLAAALILKGVSPGAALVFLMTGPATNAASVAALRKSIGTRATAIYMGTVGVTAILLGLAVDTWLAQYIQITLVETSEAIMDPIKTGFGILLILILIAAWATGMREPTDCPCE